MYPVLSLLRRLPHNIIYVREDMTRQVGGLTTIRVDTLSTVANFKAPGWVSKKRAVPIYELTVSGDPTQAAVSLTAKENHIAQQLDLLNKKYTLFVGPEEEANGTRRARLGIMLGIYRFSAYSSASIPKVRQKRTVHNLPAGTMTMPD